MPKVWFVTGSSRGLGRHIVEAALEAGDQVVATARHPEDLNDLVTAFDDKVLPLALDVTDMHAVGEAIKQGLDRFGKLDVVVNNAGYANTASVEDIEIDDFTRQVMTNFFGVVYVSKAAAPILRAQGYGHIIQIASIGSRIASVGLSAYQSAKFAVRGFSLVLAQELAPLGVKVTTLQPGGIRTDWAGASMQVYPPTPPYEQTVGAFSRFLRENSGRESSHPKKIAEVVLTIADMEHPPTELLLGVDAVQYGRAAAEAVMASDVKWYDLSVSVSG